MKLKFSNKQQQPKRDANGKFVGGSGGLTALKKFNWRRALPVVVVVSLTGGYLVFRSFAASGVGCNAGSVNGAHYIFYMCQANKEPIIPDVCTVRWAINPGPLRGKNVPYEAVSKSVVSEISKYMGVNWQYQGQVAYGMTNRPSLQDDVVLIDYSAKLNNPTLLQSRPNGVAATAKLALKNRNNRTVLNGGGVNVYTEFLETPRQSSTSASSLERGPFTASNFSRRITNVLGHELGHTAGLGDLYKNGNSAGLIDVTQKMGATTRPWGAGDKAGLKIAGSISRNLAKCHVPLAASKIDPALAAREVSASYAGLLGRTPEAAGKRYWQNSLLLGKVTTAGLAEKIALTRESKKLFSPSKTGQQAVQKIYSLALCRQPSAAELSYWATQYNNSGLSDTARSIASSAEAVKLRSSLPAARKICR